MKGITVTGTGTVTAVPDVASVEIGAEALAGSASEARAQASEAIGRIIDSLKAGGVPATDIQTSRITIQPQHDYPSGSPPRLVGYQASNTVRAKLRNIEESGAILDAALESAGDAARLHGLRFSFSEPEKLAMEARTRAVAAAKANAATLARASGVKLGKVISISEAPGASPQPRMMAMAMEQGVRDTPVEAGESTVSVSIVVRFAIKP